MTRRETVRQTMRRHPHHRPMIILMEDGVHGASFWAPGARWFLHSELSTQ